MLLKQHPLSAAFPAMTDADFAALRSDIEKHGQRDRIKLFEGQVLDGWHRYRACDDLGLEPKTCELQPGIDPVAFVLSRNLHRRHLDPGQRATVVAAATNWKEPHREKKAATLHPSAPAKRSVGEMAALASVSERTMQHAKALVATGDTEKIEAVKSGKTSVTKALQDKGLLPERKKNLADKTSITPYSTQGFAGGADPVPAVAVVDRMGYPIPVAVRPLWSRGGEVVEILEHISAARSKLRSDDPATPDPLYSDITANTVLSRLDDAYNSLKQCVPYAVCTNCQGQEPGTCRLCRGRGFIGLHAWKTVVPPEIQAMRQQRIEELKKEKRK